MVLRLPFDELVGAGADRVDAVLLAELLDGLLRDDLAARDRQRCAHERSKSLFHDDHAAVGIDDLDFLQRGPVTCIRGLHLGSGEASNALEGELDVFGRNLAVATVELDSLLQDEGELQIVIGGLKRFGQRVDNIKRAWLKADQALIDAVDQLSIVCGGPECWVDLRHVVGLSINQLLCGTVRDHHRFGGSAAARIAATRGGRSSTTGSEDHACGRKCEAEGRCLRDERAAINSLRR